MKSELDELGRKLTLAKSKLAETEAEGARLEALIAPLAKQLADAKRECRYLQARVDKLQGILAKQ